MNEERVGFYDRTISSVNITRDLTNPSNFFIYIIIAFSERKNYMLHLTIHLAHFRVIAISRSSQCSTTGVTKAAVCAILSVE